MGWRFTSSLPFIGIILRPIMCSILLILHEGLYHFIFLSSQPQGPPLRLQYGGIAQLAAHLLCKQRVAGSSPATSTMDLGEGMGA